jgi:hypothetical protein
MMLQGYKSSRGWNMPLGEVCEPGDHIYMYINPLAPDLNTVYTLKKLGIQMPAITPYALCDVCVCVCVCVWRVGHCSHMLCIGCS